jgi:uncharacterized protein (DUF1499 family)
VTRLAVLGLACALAGGLLLVLGPWGVRHGWWSYVPGLGLIGASLLVTCTAVLLLVAGARHAPVVLGAGLSLCAAVLAVPVLALWAARGTPPIHDVTTDPVDPPRFERALTLREPHATPIVDVDAARAARQRDAYPDLEPLQLPWPPAAAFERAVQAADALGWEVVARDAARGHLEAVDTTRWFGFRDDIVVRIRPAAGGSRLDVRSTSRVGIGDAGTNARRIRAFRQQLLTRS